MEKKVIPYGKTIMAKVLKVDNRAIFIHGGDGEGYILVGHGLDPLPEVDDMGHITFTKGGPTGGHWVFTPDKK